MKNLLIAGGVILGIAVLVGIYIVTSDPKTPAPSYDKPAAQRPVYSVATRSVLFNFKGGGLEIKNIDTKKPQAFAYKNGKQSKDCYTGPAQRSLKVLPGEFKKIARDQPEQKEPLEKAEVSIRLTSVQDGYRIFEFTSLEKAQNDQAFGKVVKKASAALEACSK